LLAEGGPAACVVEVPTGAVCLCGETVGTDVVVLAGLAGVMLGIVGDVDCGIRRATFAGPAAAVFCIGSA